MHTPHRFNLNALTKSRLSADAAPERAEGLSRRQLLRMGGIVLPAAFHEDVPFRLQSSGKGIALVLADRPAWVIDPERFSGAPKLEVREQKRRIDINLRQALFPGTDLPASFRAALEEDGATWQLSLSMDCGMQFHAGLMDWLSGEVPALGWWTQPVLELCRDLSLSFLNGAAVQFRPDWSFAFDGKIAASVHEIGPLEASRARLALNSGETLAGQALQRRTLLSVDRGESNWPIDLAHRAENAWTLHHDDNLFDKLTVEAGETEGQRVYTALLTQDSPNPARLVFHPSRNLKDASGAPFSLSLTAPRLALALNEPERPSAFYADFATEKKWLQTRGLRLLVGARADSLPFALFRQGGAPESLAAEPELFEAALPGEEDTCSTLTFQDRRGIHFTWANIVQPIERGLAAIHLTPWEHGVRIDLQHATLSVLRPADLLKLDFTFENLRLSTWFGARLEPTDRHDPAKIPTITVTFPQQSIGEEAFLEQPPGFQLTNFNLPGQNLTWDQKRAYEPDLPATPGGPVQPSGSLAWPARARIAERSRLVFQLPKAEHIPFRLSTLLDWSQWNMKVHPVALSADAAAKLFQGSGSTKPDIPDTDPSGYTSIEMPYRLMISPPASSTWVHSPEPVKSQTKFTELWHARLAALEVAQNGKRAVNENDTAHRTIRAIWSPDYVKDSQPWMLHHTNNPFRMPLDQQDRHEIVHLTSDFQIPNQRDCDSTSGGAPFIPGAVQVDQLILSSLGGWLKSRGTWEPPIVSSTQSKILTVEEWRHGASMGRDNYVKVVYKGYLMPFGHRASLIKVTERKFNQIGSVWGAFLRQRYYIVVKDPQKQFPAYGMTPAMARLFNYSMVEAITLLTPTLADPNTEPGSDPSHFWPLIAPNTPFQFQFRLYGEHGTTDCSMPVLFVDNSVAYDSSKSAAARNQYNQEVTGRQVIAFGGQRIAFAPENQPGDTEYNTNTIKFQVMFPDSFDNNEFPCLYSKGQPAFYPRQATLDLNPESVRRITGSDSHIVVRYADRYVTSGFDPVQNVGEVFLEIIDPHGKDLSFSGGQNGAQSGAVVTPNLRIIGFSRKNGSVGGGGKTVQSARVRALADSSSSSADAPSALDKMASGEFDPLDFFGGALAQAKILGAVSLWDIIKPLAAGALSNLDQAPKMLEQTLFPLIQDVVQLESDVVNLLGSLPDFVQKQLGAEIQNVRDNLAKVTANPVDIATQAAFIRSLTQVGDKIRTLLNNPSSLLDPALQQLSQWKDNLETALVAWVTALLQPWKDLSDQAIQSITDTVTGLTLTALAYKEQIQTYQTEIQSQVQALQVQLKSLIAFLQDPSKVAQTLAAQVPAVGQLEQLRTRTLDLIELAKQVNPDVAGLLSGLTDVQTWVLGQDAAQAEKDVEDFEAQTQIWLASLAQGSDLVTAQQLTRQAAGAMRNAIQQTGKTALADLQKLQLVHKQLLTSLQQLQTMVRKTSGTTLESSAAAAAPPSTQATLLKLFNAKAAEFSVVQQALNAGNVEMKLSGFAALLPAAVRVDLAGVASQLVTLRNAIGSASEQAQYALLDSYLQLFDLWLEYQDPFKLAADVFGLSRADLQKLQALEAQYNKILSVAQAIKTQLSNFQTAYAMLVSSLPSLAQALLNTLTANATSAIASVVSETLQENLLPIEQQAIQGLTDLYQDVLRRAAQPLQGLQDLAKAKSTLEAMIQQFGLPQSVTVSYTWNPVIKNFEPVFIVKPGGALSINAAVTAYFNGNPPQFSIDGKLTNFTINLIGSPQFIGIVFDYLNFSSHSGSQPDCQVRINKVDLSEALNFVKKLESLLNPKDGPFLIPSFDGILAGFRFAIPTITVGAFSLQHLRLIIAVNLPFSGDPMRCDFGVSERDNPFLLSVGIFGGGGFFHMRLGLDGVELLEGALEFGVVAEISIGIASGGGYVMAGIYFSVSKTEAQVCGFVHANGHLDVLGLISMDIDAFVQICYVKRGNQTFAEGEARIIVHIEILFFSQDVELRAHYVFAGSPSDSSEPSSPAAVANAAVKELAKPPATMTERTLDPPRAPGDYCDLGSASEWNKYRRAFAW